MLYTIISISFSRYDLAVAEVERGKFILAEDDLLQREHQLSKEKTDMAMVRLHKEEQLARQALITRRKDEKYVTCFYMYNYIDIMACLSYFFII